jgi:serine/threonine protein kinase
MQQTNVGCSAVGSMPRKWDSTVHYSEQVFEVRDLEKWVKELCDALEYAHKDVGLIDGDIVPGNLIVDLAGNLKLKDFGISNCIADSVSRLMAIHDTGETLLYKSFPHTYGLPIFLRIHRKRKLSVGGDTFP